LDCNQWAIIVLILVIILAAWLIIRRTEVKIKEKALSKFIVPTSSSMECKIEEFQQVDFLEDNVPDLLATIPVDDTGKRPFLLDDVSEDQDQDSNRITSYGLDANKMITEL